MKQHGTVSRGHRALVAAAAVGLGLVSVLGTGGTAIAAPGASSVPSYGNIDFTKTGSLIIHKHVNQTATDPVTGTPAGPDTLTTPGVAGVQFTAYPISSLDLSQQSSWTTLSTFTVPSDACTAGAGGTAALPGQTLGTGIAAPLTDADGLATASNLPVAAYLVCETQSPSTVVDKAQPFVVTIPFPDTTANQGTTQGWLYDVNVYPKNGVANIKKTVTGQTDLGLGSTASFPVTTDIPAIAPNASFDHYWVTDPVDSRLANVAVASVTVDGAAVDPSYYTSVVTGNYATVSFTNAGLSWLKTQPNKQVVTTFTGTVTGLGADGVINNTAYLDISTNVSPTPPTNPLTPPTEPPTTPPGTPSNQVTTNWGDVKLDKVDSGDSTTGLKGATFQVFAAQNPYAADCSTAQATGSPIAVSGSSTFTSDDSGLVSIAGLFVSDSENAPQNAAQRCYVVQEIQAPAGYVTPQGNASYTPVAVRIGSLASGTYSATIKNEKELVPGLPLTGGQGTVLASILGGLLIAGGAGGAAISRRRKQEQGA